MSVTLNSSTDIAPQNSNSFSSSSSGTNRRSQQDKDKSTMQGSRTSNRKGKKAADITALKEDSAEDKPTSSQESSSKSQKKTKKTADQEDSLTLKEEEKVCQVTAAVGDGSEASVEGTETIEPHTNIPRGKRKRGSEQPAVPVTKSNKRNVSAITEMAESPKSRRQSKKDNSQELEEVKPVGRRGRQTINNKTKKAEADDSTTDTMEDSECIDNLTPKSRKRRGHGDDSREMDLPASASKVSKRGDGNNMATPSRIKPGEEALSSPTLRKKDPKPRVMFTGVVDEHGQKIVKELGGTLAESIQECSHLVTDKIRRTVKFLGGLCLGLQIVSPQWLEESKKSGMFLESSKYIVSDKAAEKQYKFLLSQSIGLAGSQRMLQDFKFHVTKSVKPGPDTMKEILECAGAEFVKTMPKKKEDGVMIVISCVEDKKVCQPALTAGIDVVSAEFILTGILRQKVEIESFRLFGDAAGATTSTAPRSKGRRK